MILFYLLRDGPLLGCGCRLSEGKALSCINSLLLQCRSFTHLFTFQQAPVTNFEETDAYLSSPFCSEELQKEIRQQDLVESIDASPDNEISKIPTPPPDHSPDSTHSTISHGSCISPQLSASATSDSYIKGSSLEQSPLSSPNSSCSGEVCTPDNDSDMVSASEIPKLIKRESCIRSTCEKTASSDGETSSSSMSTHEQNVPKNIKLPQSKLHNF